MTCNHCKRSVRDSFVDKLRHMATYHPDMLIEKAQQLPVKRLYQIGEQLGKMVKHATIHRSR